MTVPCRAPGADPEDWWRLPLKGKSPAWNREAAAALCHGCPITAECVDTAREINATAGVWGGMILTRPDNNWRADRICEYCHEVFSWDGKSARSRWENRRFCSAKCRDSGRLRLVRA